MKMNTIPKSLLLLSLVILPFQNRQHGFYSRDSPIFVAVEGLEVAKISSRSRLRVGTSVTATVPPQATIQPPTQYHGSICKVSPMSTRLHTKATERQERARYLTILCNKNGDDDTDEDSSNTNSGDAVSEDTTDVVTTDEAMTMARNRRRDTVLDDFLYGANFVHSQYLSIVWRYSILRSCSVTVPIGIALWMNQGLGLYNSLFQVLRSVLAVSSIAALLLQLPLEVAQSLVLNIWNVSPDTLAAAINFLPNFAAIPLVQLLLAIRFVVTTVVEACCGNNAIAFVSSILAISVWRPAVEEWQYRSVLDKLLFGIPRWMLARGRDLSPSTVAMAQQLKSSAKAVETNLKAMVVGAAKNKTLEEDRSLSSNRSELVDLVENSANTTNATVALPADDAQFLPDESTRILLGSLLFATTRLGWLSSDPADTVALSNSPYGFTIGFLQSIGSLVSFGGGMPEVRHSLRIFILLLAIHQTVSTFLVAQHVFAGIYRRRGLVASVGAHVSWTVGKGTIVFRLLYKFWQSTSASVWSATYGSSPETEAVVVGGGDDGDDGNDSTTPSRGDGDEE